MNAGNRAPRKLYSTLRRTKTNRPNRLRALGGTLANTFETVLGLNLSNSDSTKRFGPRTGLRLTIVGIVAGLLFSTMLVRLWYLQVLNSPQYQKAATIDQIRSFYIPAPRGLILDRNGNVLVGNISTEEITLSRTEAIQNPAVVNRLSILLGISTQQIEATLQNKLDSPLAPVPIDTNVPLSVISYIEEHSSSFPGVQAQLVSQRVYPYGDLAAQVLGYLGPITPKELSQLKGQGYQQGDLIGQGGIEESYEAQLRGTPGIEKVAVDSQGNVVQSWIAREPVPGDNIELSIDANLQNYAQMVLANQIKYLRSTYDPYDKRYDPAPDGAVIVENPQNGHILAMASYPYYNPSVWVGGISQSAWQQLQSTTGNPLLNHAIQVGYTPGSTFKLITGTAALDSGLINPNTYIDDANGLFVIPNCTGMCTFHDDESLPGGEVNIVKAITISDDVFFYHLGYDFYIQQAKYGPTPIQNMATNYGLGVPSGIDLPGETAGIVDSLASRQFLHSHYPSAFPNPPTWYAGDQVQLAFGQGQTLETPLQLANAYATLANGGTRYTPQLAINSLSPTSCAPAPGLSKNSPPKVAGHVSYTPGTYSTLMQGFSDVIQSPNGTGYYAFQGFPLAQIPLAGKTGTAQTGHQSPNSLFVSFGPTTNPKYVVAAVIDQAGYGADGAAPVVRDMWNYLAKNPIGSAAKLSCSANSQSTYRQPNTPNPPLGSTSPPILSPTTTTLSQG